MSKPICVECGKPVDDPIVYRNDPDNSPAVALHGDKWAHMECWGKRESAILDRLIMPRVESREDA